MRTGSSGARIVRRRPSAGCATRQSSGFVSESGTSLRIGSDAYPETALCHCSGPAEARVRNRVSVGCMGDWREEGRKAGCGVKWVKRFAVRRPLRVRMMRRMMGGRRNGREEDAALRPQAGSPKRREMIEESTAAGRRRRSPPSIPVVSKSRRRVPSDAPWVSPMRRSRGACPQGPKGPLQRPAEGRRSFRPWR